MKHYQNKTRTNTYTETQTKTHELDTGDKQAQWPDRSNRMKEETRQPCKQETERPDRTFPGTQKGITKDDN